MFQIRNLNKNDYHNNYLNLLKQLTVLDVQSISKQKFDQFIDSLNNNHIVLIIEDIKKNIIIGTITIIIEQKLIRNFGKVAHIEDVVIDSNYRGQCLGKQLINEAIKISKNNNCYKIILDCDEHNIPFYQKSGFTHKGAFMSLYL